MKPCPLFQIDRPRILIRATNWVGDAVMTTPAMAVIRECFPHADITLLANPLVAELFSPHPWVNRVIRFDRKEKHKGVTGRVRLANELRRQAFDAAIILPNSFDSALVPWLAGIPIRLGKASDGRSFLLTGCYKPDKSATANHEVLYYLDLLRNFGIKGNLQNPLLAVTDQEENHATLLLAEAGFKPDCFLLGINPGAAFGSAKRWYPDRFAAVARKLADQWNAGIVIFGGSGETEIAAAIEQELHCDCLNLAGKTTVRELMALIRNCGFFVTNDSGPMHIAAAFGVPLAAIFGPTDHSGTSPYTDKAVIVRKNVPCAPCKLRECPTDHRCMTEVTADDVVSAAIELMQKIR